jgi:hypothetical protein
MAVAGEKLAVSGFVAQRLQKDDGLARPRVERKTGDTDLNHR